MEPGKAPTNTNTQPSSSSSGFGTGSSGSNNPPPPNATHDVDSDEDAPQMPGAFFPRSGSGRGSHDTTTNGDVLQTRPYPRVFAPSEAPVGNQQQQRNASRGRGMHGLPYVGRIGFAGRGLHRGTGTGIVPSGWQHREGESTPADYEERLALQAAAAESSGSQPPEDTQTETENQHDTRAEGEPTPDSSSSHSNHPLPVGLRGVRIGYAGRGAFRGRGFGRTLVGDTTTPADDNVDTSSPGAVSGRTGGDPAPLRERGGGSGPADDAPTQPETETEQDADEEEAQGGSQVPRGLRGVRIGYAGRGAYRGNGFGRVLAGGFRGLPSRRGGAGTDTGASNAAEGETSATGGGDSAADHGGNTEEKK